MAVGPMAAIDGFLRLLSFFATCFRHRSEGLEGLSWTRGLGAPAVRTVRELIAEPLKKCSHLILLARPIIRAQQLSAFIGLIGRIL